MSVPNLNIFTASELADLQAAAKAEYLARISGKITSGSKNGKSYGLATMSMTDLNALLDSLAARLGKGRPAKRRINFNTGLA